MKKKILIILCMLLVVVLTATMFACKAKVTVQKIYDAASFSADNGESSRTVKIVVGYKGETVYDSTQSDNTPDEVKAAMQEIGAPIESSFSGNGTGLAFSDNYFENAALANGVFTADIKAIETFLGVKGATGGKIVVTMTTGKKPVLDNMKITYITAENFDVEITVTMNY